MSVSCSIRAGADRLLHAAAVALVFATVLFALTGLAAGHVTSGQSVSEDLSELWQDLNRCDQNAVVEQANPYRMNLDEFRVAASFLFHRCHRRIAPNEDAPSHFRPNQAYPLTLPTPKTPWMQFDPTTQSRQYLMEVLNYAMEECGGDHADWDGIACGWFHAPWMHDLREPMRGLTEERSSRPGELHPRQTVETQNWAIGLYNDVGGYGFHQIWNDHSRPDTKDFAFANGTVAVKLLFSLATPEQVPYLRFAKTWDIHDGQRIATARLIQLDVLVKDQRLAKGGELSRNDDWSGWVMGSFLYNGAIETTPRCDQISDDIEACEQARWRDRLIPIGLQWGNDPGMYQDLQQGAEKGDPMSPLFPPVEHWLGGQVQAMFAPLRVMNGQPLHLGRDGRLNGPVDNHRSTCLACHARAVDFGRYEEDSLRLVPFLPYEEPASPIYSAKEAADLKTFFRNLPSAEPFLAGTQSLDYSLQAAVGLQAFREWVNGLPLEDKNLRKIAKSDRKYYSRDAVTGQLTLATWNISNLHHQSGESLRIGSPKRSDNDYARLARMAEKLDADIIALQEIGSPAALARVFSPEEYHLVISDRYSADDEYRDLDERDIYTAFAFRRDLFPKVPKVKTVGAALIQHEQFDKYDVYESRPTRAAMSVEFEYSREGEEFDTYALLNVHLKSGCARRLVSDHEGRNRALHEAFACRTLVAQFEQIENWFEAQHRLGRKVLIVGDLNRQLNWQEESNMGLKLDQLWSDLNDWQPIKLHKGPPDSSSDCWPNHSENRPSSIDFIIGDVTALTETEAKSIQKKDYGVVIPFGSNEYDGKEYLRLSDHCPVVVTLKQ